MCFCVQGPRSPDGDRGGQTGRPGVCASRGQWRPQSGRGTVLVFLRVPTGSDGSLNCLLFITSCVNVIYRHTSVLVVIIKVAVSIVTIFRSFNTYKMLFFF